MHGHTHLACATLTCLRKRLDGPAPAARPTPYRSSSRRYARISGLVLSGGGGVKGAGFGTHGLAPLGRNRAAGPRVDRTGCRLFFTLPRTGIEVRNTWRSTGGASVKPHACSKRDTPGWMRTLQTDATAITSTGTPSSSSCTAHHSCYHTHIVINTARAHTAAALKPPGAHTRRVAVVLAVAG